MDLENKISKKSDKRKLVESVACGIVGAAAGAYFGPDLFDLIQETKSYGIYPKLEIGLGSLIGYGFGTQVYDSYLK